MNVTDEARRGAPAHYGTGELAEEPIIKHDSERVGHERGPPNGSSSARRSRRASSRAVAGHAERRVLLNGGKPDVSP